MFLSVLRDLKKIPVFADLHERTINGPDIVMEYFMDQDFSDSKTIQGIRTRGEIMKPRLGVCAVIMDPTSKSGSFEIAENISAFSVGLEPSGFQPIINKLV
jgi:hypothetical protein